LNNRFELLQHGFELLQHSRYRLLLLRSGIAHEERKGQDTDKKSHGAHEL
jgi:hypothetical protein